MPTLLLVLRPRNLSFVLSSPFEREERREDGVVAWIRQCRNDVMLNVGVLGIWGTFQSLRLQFYNGAWCRAAHEKKRTVSLSTRQRLELLPYGGRGSRSWFSCRFCVAPHTIFHSINLTLEMLLSASCVLAGAVSLIATSFFLTFCSVLWVSCFVYGLLTLSCVQECLSG